MDGGGVDGGELGGVGFYLIFFWGGGFGKGGGEMVGWLWRCFCVDGCELVGRFQG